MGTAIEIQYRMAYGNARIASIKPDISKWQRSTLDRFCRLILLDIGKPWATPFTDDMAQMVADLAGSRALSPHGEADR